MQLHRTDPRRYTSGLALVLLLCAVGCGSPSDANSVIQVDTEGREWTVVRDGDKPVALVAGDGRELPFKNGRVIIDAKIVLLHRDGQTEVHRTPNSIVKQRSALPFLYLKEDSLEHVVTEGCQGTGYVDPSDGRICWPALTCGNPQCAASDTDGQQVLFIQKLAGAVARPDGTLGWDSTAGGAVQLRCPHCNVAKHIRRYLLPAEAEGRERLDAELATVRAAMRRTKASR